MSKGVPWENVELPFHVSCCLIWAIPDNSSHMKIHIHIVILIEYCVVKTTTAHMTHYYVRMSYDKTFHQFPQEFITIVCTYDCIYSELYSKILGTLWNVFIALGWAHCFLFLWLTASDYQIISYLLAFFHHLI